MTRSEIYNLSTTSENLVPAIIAEGPRDIKDTNWPVTKNNSKLWQGIPHADPYLITPEFPTNSQETLDSINNSHYFLIQSQQEGLHSILLPKLKTLMQHVSLFTEPNLVSTMICQHTEEL